MARMPRCAWQERPLGGACTTPEQILKFQWLVRQVPVSDTVREQILSCTDLTRLETWLRRAVTATTAEDVIHP